MENKFNFDHCKTYGTIEALKRALSKFSDYTENDAMPIIVPYGKHQGRYTAVIRFCGGDNIHWAHRGFMVFG